MNGCVPVELHGTMTGGIVEYQRIATIGLWTEYQTELGPPKRTWIFWVSGGEANRKLAEERSPPSNM